MKKNLFPCLLLSGAMLLTLTACGGDTQTTPTPEVTVTPEIEATATPEVTVPDESETPDTENTPEVTPEATPEVTATPEATPEATPTPEATKAPVATPAPTAPAETPAPTPAPSAPVAEHNATAAEVYAAVFAAGGGAADFEVSDMIDTFYSVSLDDLADAVYYMPMTSANVEELFIARVQSGKLSDVKAACEERLEQLKADAELYVATGAYVANAQIVTEGDWIMLCVCPDADAAVNAFRDSVK